MHFLNLIFLFIFFIFTAENTTAQSKLRNAKFSKIGFVYQAYSGNKNISFAEGGAGYGIEMAIDSGGDIFRYFTKAKVIYSEGTQNFLDNSTEVRSAYKFTQVAPELGFTVYPVAKKKSGLNLYVWAVGILSYQFFDLTPISKVTNGGVTTSVTTYAQLKNRDQGYGYGAGGGIGFDMFFSEKSRPVIKSMYGEIGFREQAAQIANRNDFQINSINFMVGFGF